MRLEHGVMLAIGVLVGALIAGRELPPWDLYALAFLTALLLEASTFALNDYCDYDIDKLNNRTDRPLVRGDATKNEALAIFAILFPLGITCSYFVNWWCFVIALVTAAFAVLYDVAMKRCKLAGNFYIAYTMAIPFIFGAVSVVENGVMEPGVRSAIILLFVIAFLAGAGREIMKDVQDMEGDRKVGVRSFATVFGPKAANALAANFYVVAVALSVIPFLSASYELYHMNFYYLVPVVATDAMLLYCSVALVASKRPDMRALRAATLAALFAGLMAFLLGAFLG